MSRQLAINISEHTDLKGGGRNATFWNHVQTRFSKEALRTKHLVGKERDKFVAELVKRRDALTALEEALEQCKEHIQQTKPVNMAKRAALVRERNNISERIKRARKRYIDYQNKSIELNFRFILKNAARYSVSVPPDKFDDLIQECVLGWQRGLRTYNQKKSQLTTHSAFWIYQAVQRYVFNDSLIRVPVYIWEELHKLNRLGMEFPEGATEYMKGCVTNARILSSHSSYQSLDNKIFDDGDSATFADILVDDNPAYPEDLINAEEVGITARAILDFLPSKREREILIRRFGFNGNEDGETLDSIAADFGITRERVRQIESKALEKIRININNGRLKIQASKTVKLRVIQGGGG